MKLAIVGTGYVGLVQGAVFADTGNDVICMDIDKAKIEKLQKGEIPIYEPGLEELVRKNIADGRLQFTSSLKKAVEESEIIFLCLPTPESDTGSVDLSLIMEVVNEIAEILENGKIIVSKSTVPVGTASKIREVLLSKGKDKIEVVSNPEFLKEGAAVQDSMKPDRIIIGTSSQKAIWTMMEVYAPFVRTGNPILVMDEHSAEMTKYAANAFLATKISFMNEMATICEGSGADIDWVRKGIGFDSRIGQQFLFSGLGYGGSCFPKDVKALIKASEELGCSSEILKAVDRVNRNQKGFAVRQLLKHFKNDLKGKVVTIWGLSFKPNTDDMREAPSLVTIQGLLEAGAVINAHDPVSLPNARMIFGSNIRYFEHAYDSLRDSDALVIVTEWNEFRRPDFSKMHKLMRTRVVVDGRNIYDPKVMRDKGFVYYGVGRKIS